MATALSNLSNYDPSKVPVLEGKKIGIVIAEWNSEITNALATGAISTLLNHGFHDNDIMVIHVPGSYELPSGAQYLAESNKVDAVICLGCVIQGETRHFEFISSAVAEGILRISIDYGMPVVFGVLTTDNLAQAKDRSGGKHGNKGVEAAITAIKMIALRDEWIFEE